MSEPQPQSSNAQADVTARPDEPGLVMRRIHKPDGRYLLLYTFLRENEA